MQIQPIRSVAKMAAVGVLLSTFNPQLSKCCAQGTAFSYQGFLTDNGSPANGVYDLQFNIFDAPTGGNPAGGSTAVSDLSITNGVFSIVFDPGIYTFPGADRWLQIAVRPGASTGPLTNLVPRSAILPTPYAITAGNVTGPVPSVQLSGPIPSANISGAYGNAVNFNNAGNNFTGNGAGLSYLNASQLTAGTVADARLSANVALLNSSPTFTGTVTAQNFVGSGAGLTGIGQRFGTGISSAPYTITQPGSYFLTTNLTVSSGNAITIAANSVTLDLSGFTISSTAPSATGSGILLSNASLIHIHNGHIRGGVTNQGGTYSGSGFNNGITYSGNAPANVRVAGVSVSGCLDSGIYLQNINSVVESCTVKSVGGYGIVASTITHCAALLCGITAISGITVSDCHAGAYSHAIQAQTAHNCYGGSSVGIGINAQIADNCYGSSGSSAGLYIYGTASNCRGTSSSSVGVFSYLAISCHGTCSGSSYGLQAIDVANACYGFSASGTGLSASIANSCRGQSTSGTGLSAYIAHSSQGTSVSGTAQSINFKYNMP